MRVLLTGAYGRCGTALLDHLDDSYSLIVLNRSDRGDDHPYGGYDTIVADISDADAVEQAAKDCDAIVHLAAYPYVEGSFDDVLEPNVVGLYNALEAARKNEIETFVFGSTNHVMGGYEREFAPDLYYGVDPPFRLTHADPTRPDSYYGVTKAFGEQLGQYYVEQREYPTRMYALRICSVRMPEYDHPYGDAEAGVDNGEFERGSDEYGRAVARMKAMWQSRRDFAHMVECCLQDDTVSFSTFNGVSDNDRRWFDIEHAREVIGYDPKDNAERWTEPP